MKKTIDTIVEGGKATSGPPLGPALGPMGINAGQVVAKINEMTKAFSGMKVPVKVTVNTDDKSFEVHVGSPPTSELVKKEAGIEKGGANAEAPAGNISFEGLVKIAEGKKMNSLGKSLKDVAKEVAGTCKSLGVTIDGKDPVEAIREIDGGKHDSVLK
ncbi:MAG: 50S ribosomal protein L11 [Candidatus Micrarchaeia archaeon]|jgi:large subunit ribosomal protein L11